MKNVDVGRLLEENKSSFTLAARNEQRCHVLGLVVSIERSCRIYSSVVWYIYFSVPKNVSCYKWTMEVGNKYRNKLLRRISCCNLVEFFSSKPDEILTNLPPPRVATKFTRNSTTILEIRALQIYSHTQQ